MSLTKCECRWVRARLPLWVGDADFDQTATNNKAGDLSAQDYQRIERHIAICPSCYKQQIALKKAFSAILTASVEPPLNGTESSLWPGLEQRINRQITSLASSKVRSACGWNNWLTHFLIALNNPQPRLRSFVVSSVVASLLLLLISGIITRWQSTNAKSTVHEDSAPLVQAVTPLITADIPTKLADISDGEENSENHLAEAELAPTSETSASRAGIVAPKSAAHTR